MPSGCLKTYEKAWDYKVCCYLGFQAATENSTFVGRGDRVCHTGLLAVCMYVDFWRLGLEREPEKEKAPVS